MTITAFAAGTPETPTAGLEYRPGVCNIGPEEIARRRRSGHVALVATVVLLAVLVAIGAPPLVRLLLILPAGAAASGYLQARLKFCAGFGIPRRLQLRCGGPDARGARCGRSRSGSNQGQADRPGEPRHRPRRRGRRRPSAAMTTLEREPAKDSATADPIERVAAALRAHNIEAIVVETGDEARETVLGLIPDGAEVHSGQVEDPRGRRPVRRDRRVGTLRRDPPAHVRDGPRDPGSRDPEDGRLGGLHARQRRRGHRGGALVAASATGSQLGPYAAGAGRVILVVGSQKIVPDLDAALRRINEVVFPWEDAQVQQRLGVHTVLDKILVIYGEWQAGRTTVVLVREPVGV